MTNHNQQSNDGAANSQTGPELAPRLVLFFIALVIGGIVAISFGHGVNIYGYRMEQSAIKLQGNPEQFGKASDGKMELTSNIDWVNYSLTDNADDKGAKFAESTKPEFYYRFTFEPGHLTASHRIIQTYDPTIEGKCERILLNEEPIDPIEPEPRIGKFAGIADNGKTSCYYTFDFDDYFTWDIKKPEEVKDWVNK